MVLIFDRVVSFDKDAALRLYHQSKPSISALNRSDVIAITVQKIEVFSTITGSEEGIDSGNILALCVGVAIFDGSSMWIRTLGSLATFTT